jgi:hypothetical protein
MLIPDRHRWRDCRFASREGACLRKKISPADERERDIRRCDVCSTGTKRARGLAAHHRSQNASAMRLEARA